LKRFADEEFIFDLQESKSFFILQQLTLKHVIRTLSFFNLEVLTDFMALGKLYRRTWYLLPSKNTTYNINNSSEHYS